MHVNSQVLSTGPHMSANTSEVQLAQELVRRLSHALYNNLDIANFANLACRIKYINVSTQVYVDAAPRKPHCVERLFVVAVVHSPEIQLTTNNHIGS
ncbi:hypothetical protein FBU31_000183 [Coemansia sp. 'formosensis']|nr:hypothetical protein FBU31_000183 [Coemansia sp. 'formosensis']